MRSCVLINPHGEALMVEAGEDDIITVTTPQGQERMTVAGATRYADALLDRYGSDVAVFARAVLEVAHDVLLRQRQMIVKLEGQPN